MNEKPKPPTIITAVSALRRGRSQCPKQTDATAEESGDNNGTLDVEANAVDRGIPRHHVCAAAILISIVANVGLIALAVLQWVLYFRAYVDSRIEQLRQESLSKD